MWAARKDVNCVNSWKEETEEDCNLDRLYSTQDILKKQRHWWINFKWKIEINVYMKVP